MRIVVTNDDGIESLGLRVLASSMIPIGDVYVVAPKTPQSAGSHATTLHKPLRIEEYLLNIGEKYSVRVSGTPADCVLLAKDEIVEDGIDIVVSGMNSGPNLGYDVIYSGTVAGAREGAINEILSFAFSVDSIQNPDFTYAGEFAPAFIRSVLDKKLKGRIYFNVNFPNLPKSDIKGYKFVRQGRREYINRIFKGSDPFERTYYWIGGKLKEDYEEDTDAGAVRDGYVSITPMTLDFTDYNLLKHLSDIKIDL